MTKDPFGDWVLTGDAAHHATTISMALTAAKSELAALREELEREKSRYDREVLGLNNEGDPIGGDPAGGYKNDNVQLQQRLTAAERRNRTLEILLRRASNYGGLTPEWHDAVQAALAKPTESGASE
jgi:hypothetical protein